MDLESEGNFTDSHRKLAKAVYMDLIKTYPQMTLEYVMNQARYVAAGNEPKGIAGVRLEDVFKQAGLLS